MALCTCCEEREIWPDAAAHGYEYCEECSKTTTCSNCGDNTCYLHVEWETDSDLHLCDRCRERDQKATELVELEETVLTLAAEYQWDVADKHRAGTGSIYIELHRECDACILGKDDDCTCETLKVRVSDHGSCYCSEDISLVIRSGNVGGDDHTIETLRRRLVRKPAVETN